jgi:hypothetical protein
MKFYVHLFEIDRKPNRHGIFGKEFWGKVAADHRRQPVGSKRSASSLAGHVIR